MTFKFETQGNYFIITNIVTNYEILRKAKSDIYSKPRGTRVWFYDISSDHVLPDRDGYDFSQIVDVNGNPFASFTALISYLSSNTGNSIPFLGSIIPTSVPTGTLKSFWLATQAGTYTNFGNVVVNSNSLAVISRDDAGVFTVSQTTFDLSSYLQKQSLKTVLTSVNIFNKANIIIGKEVGATATFDVEPNSAISDFIEIPTGATNIYISGLTAYTSASNHSLVAFYDINKIYIANSLAVIEQNLTEKGFAVPTNSKYVAFSIYQRKTSAEIINLNTIQVEVGGVKSVYTDYTTAITEIENKPLLANINTEQLSFDTISKNLFNKANIITGKEVYGDGTFELEPNSAISGYVSIPDNATNIYISGLTVYTGLSRYLAFYDVNKVLTVVYASTNGILNTLTEKGFAVPTNSKYVAFSIYQRKTSAEIINLNTIQVEVGNVKSAYSSYELGISKIGNNKIFTSNVIQYQFLPIVSEGMSMLCFGDSITETANVSDDGLTYTEDTRSNWAKFTKSTLKIGIFTNYAKSGGNWKDAIGLEFRQKISNQISTAITNNIPADIIVISCGTNSAETDLGNYATAMGKTTLISLDRTLTYEAIRWSLWTLRNNYPNANMFIATPIQRADREPLVNLSNAIISMAKRYNFTIIDAEYESGIVREFENWELNGRYLVDGLHPNLDGQLKMSKLFNIKILQNIK